MDSTRNNEKLDVTDIPLKLPQKELDDNFLRNFSFYENYEYEEFDTWIYYHSGGGQGSLHEWAFIKKGETQFNMVAFGRYSFHENWSFLCNARITKSQLKELAKKHN